MVRKALPGNCVQALTGRQDLSGQGMNSELWSEFHLYVLFFPKLGSQWLQCGCDLVPEALEEAASPSNRASSRSLSGPPERPPTASGVEAQRRLGSCCPWCWPSGPRERALESGAPWILSPSAYDAWCTILRRHLGPPLFHRSWGTGPPTTWWPELRLSPAMSF